MGKVIRISKKTEEYIEELKNILIRQIAPENDNIEMWKKLMLPSDSQLIERSLGQTLEYITEQIKKGELKP